MKHNIFFVQSRYQNSKNWTYVCCRAKRCFLYLSSTMLQIFNECDIHVSYCSCINELILKTNNNFSMSFLKNVICTKFCMQMRVFWTQINEFLTFVIFYCTRMFVLKYFTNECLISFENIISLLFYIFNLQLCVILNVI